MKVVEEVMTRNSLKDSDLILGNMLWVTELLITGTRYLHCNCVHCKTINIFKKHLSLALESGAV